MQLVDLTSIGIYPLGRSRVFRQASLYFDAPLGVQAAINVSMQIAVIDGSRHHIIVLLDPAEWHSAVAPYRRRRTWEAVAGGQADRVKENASELRAVAVLLRAAVT